MQTVFRVTPTRTNSRSQHEAVEERPTVVRPRRTHKKSRLGCQNCKIRRIKCDENRSDGCQNCKKHGIDCGFLVRSSQLGSGKNKLPLTALTRVRSPFPSIYLRSASPKLCSPLSSASYLEALPSDLAPVLQTFKYFVKSTCATVTSSAGIDIFEDSLLALAHHRDYLMHAMLGIAAAHLSGLDSITQDHKQLKRFRKTESYHWHHAIRLYRQELANELVLNEVDGLITTCMLLGIHSLNLHRFDDISFINLPRSQRQAKLNWLIVPIGFRVVLQHVRQYITKSVWFELFNAATPAQDGWTIDLDRTEGIYAAFLDLCDLNPHNKWLPNPYKDILKHLFALLQIEQLSMQHLAQLMAFIGRLDEGFQALLIARESRALLILLYWLFLLDGLDLWWVKSRAEQEARAILNFLELDADPRIRAMLEIPRAGFQSAL